MRFRTRNHAHLYRPCDARVQPCGPERSEDSGRLRQLDATAREWKAAREAVIEGASCIKERYTGLCINCGAASAYEAVCTPEDARRTLVETEAALLALLGTPEDQ